jgi:hypothetical protein
VETDYTGDSFFEKTIEKTILRVLGSSEFSHSLDPKRTLLKRLLEMIFAAGRRNLNAAKDVRHSDEHSAHMGAVFSHLLHCLL